MGISNKTYQENLNKLNNYIQDSKFENAYGIADMLFRNTGQPFFFYNCLRCLLNSVKGKDVDYLLESCRNASLREFLRGTYFSFFMKWPESVRAFRSSLSGGRQNKSYPLYTVLLAKNNISFEIKNITIADAARANIQVLESVQNIKDLKIVIKWPRISTPNRDISYSFEELEASQDFFRADAANLGEIYKVLISVQESVSTAQPAKKLNKFPTPPGTSWNQLKINIFNDEWANITIGDVTIPKVHYTKMGFSPGRGSGENVTPGALWELLKLFGNMPGNEISPSILKSFAKRYDDEALIQNMRTYAHIIYGYGPKTLKTKVSQLRSLLKSYFEIKGKPITKYNISKSYKTIFIISVKF